MHLSCIAIFVKHNVINILRLMNLLIVRYNLGVVLALVSDRLPAGLLIAFSGSLIRYRAGRAKHVRVPVATRSEKCYF